MEQRYWLVKSEPDCYSIDDLARDSRDPWSGVRNYQARNYMRDEMKLGDKVLFHHSNATPPGIVGIAEVVSEPYPDPTQFDPESEYFDPTSNPSEPRWVLVDIGFVEKFPRLLSLSELKADGELNGMELTKRGSRLSVQKVSPVHYAHIVTVAKAGIEE
jgi:predicted RNA-binding protein with PUA-like domain